MFNFVRNFLPDRSNPIGIDFGAGRLRMAQTLERDGELRLVWAEARDVPAGVVTEPAKRSAFFVGATREMLAGGAFSGRRAVLCLPAWMTEFRHVRPARFVADEARSIVRSEMAGKLPLDVSSYVMRHVIAGEFPGEQGTHCEVIVMASEQQSVQNLLDDAGRAGIDVVGLVPQPRVLIDCFQRIYRRQVDADAVNLFVDIGRSGTRVMVGHGGQLRFARRIAFGSGDLPDELLGDLQGGREVVGSHTARHTQTAGARLVDDLELCRRYYESTFPDKPISRLVFVGGEACNSGLYQEVAQATGLPAQVGDPLVRFNRATLPQCTAFDRREPQPGWAVSIGASLGSPVGAGTSVGA